MRFIRLLALPVVFALASCSSDPSSSGIMQSAVRLSNAPIEAPARFRALEAEGAPAMKVSVEARGTAAPFRLSSSNKGYETWLGSDGVSLTFQDGILVETRGLGGDVMASDVTALSRLIETENTGAARRIVDVLTGSDHISSMVFDCQVSDRGSRRLEGLNTHLVTEQCSGRDIQFTNLYWRAGGRMVQSRQWAGPYTGMVAIKAVQP